MAEDGEIIEATSKIIRMVNLDPKTNEKTLREFIMAVAKPAGQIEKLFIRRNCRIGIHYAYVIFNLAEDAVKTSDMLNGYMYNQIKLEVELIGPNLKYKIYDKQDWSSLDTPATVKLGAMDAAIEKLFGKRKHDQTEITNKKQKTNQRRNPIYLRKYNWHGRPYFHRKRY